MTLHTKIVSNSAILSKTIYKRVTPKKCNLIGKMVNL